jgi:uncharacterized protein
MTLLGEDEHGTWLYAPRGAQAMYAEHGDAPLPVSFLTLVPHGEQWWMATWMRDNDEIDIDLYIDIVHPPQWSSGRLVIVDLDLDVIRRRGGQIELDDEDEFEIHARELQYPPAVITTARATAATLVAAAAAGTPPLSAPPVRWVAAGQARKVV